MIKAPLRVAFDTSVLLSIAGRPGKIYSNWKAVLDGDLQAFTSEHALDELRDVLGRPEIRAHYGESLDPVNVNRFISFYRQIATVLINVPDRFVLQADPKDSPFLNLAIEAKAHFLVTYDEVHLLALRNPSHLQHDEFKALAPSLRFVKPAELAEALKLLRFIRPYDDPGDPTSSV